VIIKRALLALLVLAGVVLLIGGAAGLYLTYDAKPRIQAVAADALGVGVAIDGAVHIGLLPLPHLALGNVHLSSPGGEFASAGDIDLGIALLPLLHAQVRIDRIELKRLRLTLELDRNGKLNVRSSRPPGPLPDVVIGRITGSRVLVQYEDQRTGARFEADDCNLQLHELRLAPGPAGDWLKNLAFAGKAACGRVRMLAVEASTATLSFEESNGVLDVNPLSMQLFGGHGSGSISADLTRAQPLYQVRYVLASFRVEDLFKAFTPRQIVSGGMDFSASLSLQGTSVEELTRSAMGEVSLRGSDLTLQVGDLDGKFDQFDATQSFNLLDVGAFLVAGPIGIGIEKGYDYARLLHTSPGSTSVRKLVSDWRVNRGVAQDRDVALATSRNRLALKGRLDFVTRQFEDVTLALLSPEGCVQVEQQVRGPFSAPEVKPPGMLKTLTGPTRRLLGKATSLLGHKCVSFYSGTVEAPK